MDTPPSEPDANNLRHSFRTRFSQLNDPDTSIINYHGCASLETSKHSRTDPRGERLFPTWESRIPVSLQLKSMSLPLDDSWNNACQTHVTERECRHCWEGYQPLSTTLLFTICPASEQGAPPPGASAGVVRLLNYCEWLQRQCGHKGGWDLNPISSLRMSVTSTRL